jgi:hypothetical protein
MLQACAQSVDFKVGHHFGEGQRKVGASPTKVGTYAYVNPIVTVRFGYFVGGEALSLQFWVLCLF